jgi:hypothetical protein
MTESPTWKEVEDKGGREEAVLWNLYLTVNKCVYTFISMSLVVGSWIRICLLLDWVLDSCLQA